MTDIAKAYEDNKAHDRGRREMKAEYDKWIDAIVDYNARNGGITLLGERPEA